MGDRWDLNGVIHDVGKAMFTLEGWERLIELHITDSERYEKAMVIRGREPAATSDQGARLAGEWKTDMPVWWLHDELNKAEEEQRRSGRVLRSAEYVGDPERIEQAKQARAESLLRLAEALEDISGRGLRPPAIHREIADELKAVGIDYRGPVHSDSEVRS